MARAALLTPSLSSDFASLTRYDVLTLEETMRQLRRDRVMAGQGGPVRRRLSPSLVPMVCAILDQPVVDDGCLRQSFPKAAQFEFALQHLGALLEMMAPVISKMRELGADERAIARALRVIVEELEALEPRRPARLEFPWKFFCRRLFSAKNARRRSLSMEF